MSLSESSPAYADNIESGYPQEFARPDIMPPSSEPTVSIVIATYARRDRLIRCIERVRQNVRIAHETIVVGGGAGDGTEDWLARQSDVRFIREVEREGATRAYNKGFRAANGAYVMWLNDDSYPLPGAVEAAVRMIERPDLSDVGMVAFYHNYDRKWNRTDSVERDGQTYGVYNVRGAIYANFGCAARSWSGSAISTSGIISAPGTPISR
jgi:GT2 family glycosyltransferase